jgi:hypothetical protein
MSHPLNKRSFLKQSLAAILCGASFLAPGGLSAEENVIQAVPEGIEAYIYGYPLVTMEMTRRVMTNVAKPEGTRAPMGHFVRMRQYPSAEFRDVTAPNADMMRLYWPKEEAPSIIDGSWKIPHVKAVD